LNVEDRHLSIVDDIEGDVTDGVLSVTLKFEFYDVDEDDSETFTPMEELDFNAQ
jgi:hypothetical protein